MGKKTKIFRLNEWGELSRILVRFYQDLENLQS